MSTSCSMRRNCAASPPTPVRTAGSSSHWPFVTTSGPPPICTRCHKHNRRCKTSRPGFSTGRRFSSTTAAPRTDPTMVIRRLARLEGVLIRRGHDRRDVVDARVMRPRHLHPDAIADRHPVPVAGRAPPLLSRGSDPGVEVVLPRAALKDPVSHPSLPLRLSGGSRAAIVPHGESPPLVLTAEIFSLSGTGGGAC